MRVFEAWYNVIWVGKIMGFAIILSGKETLPHLGDVKHTRLCQRHVASAIKQLNGMPLISEAVEFFETYSSVVDFKFYSH